ncbi:MAG TPA: CHASE4 domain-containing protein [Candidatus Acidoferrales bacterium]
MPSSLRRKTLLIIAIAMVGLVGGMYVLSRALLMRSFTKLEADVARENIERASSALTNEINTLDRTTSEYGSWDQTNAFVHGQNETYSKSEFPATTFAQLKINFVAIADVDGNLRFAKGFNPDLGGDTFLPVGLRQHLKPGSLLLTHASADSRVSGILLLPDGPVLVDSRPILLSNGTGPVSGSVVMGRLLDEAELARIGAMTHVALVAQRIDQPSAPIAFQNLNREISAENPVAVQPLSDESVAAYQRLDDIYGKPALIMQVVLPRTIYQQGRTSQLQFLLLLIAAALVFGAVTLFLLERFVISRIANLTESITQIGASGNLSERLKVSGHDELAFLGTAVNGMLEDLEKSQIDRHEGRTRLAVLLEKMPAVLWTADKDYRFTSGLGAGLEKLGEQFSRMTGKTLFEYFQTNDPNFPSILAHRQALGGDSITYELDWQNHVFEAHVQPFHNSEGELLGVIGVALDITDRKHLADQLRQSAKMQAVGELAGGVAHDFNNLLMVVKGHAEMLTDRLAAVPSNAAAPALQNVVQIQQAAERAAALTRQLLAFSRRQVLQPRVLDLNDAVAGMIQMVSRVIGENIELAFLPGANLSRVKADPSQIEQVILNLVVNARDAMPEGGRLTIETLNVDLDHSYVAQHAVVEPGPYVMLTVSDTGTGMDAATQARIFEPFFTTKEQGRGTGLGLATVYGVVKQSGGYIWVYSEMGQGTTFKVYLPQVKTEADKPTPEKVTAGPAPGTETILLVEDEESVRELVSEYLQARGYRILEASDGVVALDLAAKHAGPIQLLITDVVMPRISGRELATRLAGRQPGLKVLYISGYTDDSIFRHGVLEGGMSFLQKPFNLKAIAQKVREVLDGVPETAISGRSLEDF